jgi:hypothetical protein
LSLFFLITELGIVVIEAAGNGGTNLDTFVESSGNQILNSLLPVLKIQELL